MTYLDRLMDERAARGGGELDRPGRWRCLICGGRWQRGTYYDWMTHYQQTHEGQGHVVQG